MRSFLHRWLGIVTFALTLPGAIAEDVVARKPGFPGITFPLKGRFIDLDAEVCLEAGSLELIACSKNTKEHESILALVAHPLHIHTALLLIGGKPAEPPVEGQEGGDEEGVTKPPFEGGKFEVFIVMINKEGKQEIRPIADFVQKIKVESVFIDQPTEQNVDRRFPTSHFTFIGSSFGENDHGSPGYLAALSGNIVAVSYFGDEILGLPDAFGHENGSLSWEINPKYLPEVGTEVKLRLKLHER